MNAQPKNHAVPKAILCDPNLQRLKQSKNVLSMYFQVDTATDPADALALMKKHTFHVAFLDKEMGNDFFSLCARIYPQVWIMAGGDQWTEDEAQSFQKIGVRMEDFFQYPFITDDLREIVHSLGFTVNTAREPAPIVHPFPSQSAQPSHTPYSTYYSPSQPQSKEWEQVSQGYHQVSAAAAPAHPPYPQHSAMPSVSHASHYPGPQRQGMGVIPGYFHAMTRGVYSFYAPKGGVGKTTVSANMALALGILQPQARVCLVDFDIFFGNVASMLKVEPKRTVLDWIHAPDTMNEEMVFDCLVRHPSGLWVLPAPTKAVEEEFVTAQVAEKIVGNLKQYFDLVLVDLGPIFRDSTIIAFQYSEKIFLISDLDRLTLSDTYEMQEEFNNMEVPISKIELIFNNVSGSEGISVKQAKEAMPYPVVGTVLPSDPKIKWAMNNKNEPIVLSLPKSPFSKVMMVMTEQLFGAEQSRMEKKSIFSFFSRKKEGRLR